MKHEQMDLKPIESVVARLAVAALGDPERLAIHIHDELVELEIEIAGEHSIRIMGADDFNALVETLTGIERRQK